MSGYTDRFGGSAVNPADVSYKAYTISVNLDTQWPPYATQNNVLARTMNIIALSAALQVKLPDAREASPGETIVFYNTGANPYYVVGHEGTIIMTVSPGDRRMIELIDNTVADGSWLVTLLGVGTATLDIAGAAGAGLKAIGTTLNVAFQVETVNSSRAITPGDRDKVLIWTGGTGTLSLPATTGLEDFNFEVRNQGTGALTLAGAGGETVDGSSTIIFNTSESAWIHADAGSWYTIGRGRNTQFNFTQLVKTVTGGIVTESLTEASNVVQTINGTLTSNLELVLPAVVQVYYMSNQTTGAFNFLVRNPGGGGASVSIPSGQNAILFSDGTNVINAATTVSGIGSVVFGAGSAASPSVQIGAVNTGLYSPGAGQLGISTSGAGVTVFSTTGMTVSTAGNTVSTVESTGGNSTVQISRPSGALGGVQINSVFSPRLYIGTDSTADNAGNVGSNLVFQAYDNAGTLLNTSLRMARATGTTALFTFTDPGASGVNLKLVGNGVSTPSKTLRVMNGAFNIINDAYSTAILTLADNGNLSIAGTLTSVGQATSGSISTGTINSAAITCHAINSTGNMLVTGNITATGSVTAFSDKRLKSNIEAIVGALERLRVTEPVTYIKDGKLGRGYIAQQMQPFYPELVEPVGDFLSFNYMGMVADLHAAILTLDAQLNKPSTVKRFTTWLFDLVKGLIAK